jgi:predicted GNAT superfamily acetyltransferase
VLEPGDDGLPVLTPGEADALLCRVPGDIVALRHAEATVADTWRAALRTVFVGAFGEGRRVSTVTRDGCYILERR